MSNMDVDMNTFNRYLNCFNNSINDMHGTNRKSYIEKKKEKAIMEFEEMLQMAKEKNEAYYWLAISGCAKRIRGNYSYWINRGWEKVKEINGYSFEKWKKLLDGNTFYYKSQIWDYLELSAKSPEECLVLFDRHSGEVGMLAHYTKKAIMALINSPK